MQRLKRKSRCFIIEYPRLTDKLVQQRSCVVFVNSRLISNYTCGAIVAFIIMFAIAMFEMRLAHLLCAKYWEHGRRRWNISGDEMKCDEMMIRCGSHKECDAGREQVAGEVSIRNRESLSLLLILDIPPHSFSKQLQFFSLPQMMFFFHAIESFRHSVGELPIWVAKPTALEFLISWFLEHQRWLLHGWGAAAAKPPPAHHGKKAWVIQESPQIRTSLVSVSVSAPIQLFFFFVFFFFSFLCDPGEPSND